MRRVETHDEKCDKSQSCYDRRDKGRERRRVRDVTRIVTREVTRDGTANT